MSKQNLLVNLRAGCGFVLGYLTLFLGGWDTLLRALLIVMAADIVTGLLIALREKALSSAVGFRGISKKALILLIVGLSHVLDESIGGGALLGFYISNEGLSVLENAARLGLPVPEKLKGALSQLRAKEENHGTTV